MKWNEMIVCCRHIYLRWLKGIQLGRVEDRGAWHSHCLSYGSQPLNQKQPRGPESKTCALQPLQRRRQPPSLTIFVKGSLPQLCVRKAHKSARATSELSAVSPSGVMDAPSHFDRGLGPGKRQDRGDIVYGEGKVALAWLGNISHVSVPASLLSMTNTFDCCLSL